MKRTEKDMTQVRRIVPFNVAIKKDIRSADLKNYQQNGNRVMLEWNMNSAATRDKMFRVTIGSSEAIIDLEEFLSYSRLM